MDAMDSTDGKDSRIPERHRPFRAQPAILLISLIAGIVLGASSHWLGITGMLLLLLSLALLAIVQRLTQQRCQSDDLEPLSSLTALERPPATPEDQPPPPGASAPERSGHPATRPGDGLSGTRILLLTDDTTDRQELGQWLASWGAEVTRTNRMAEALYLLQKGARNGAPFRIAIVVQGRLATSSDQFAILVRSEPCLQTLFLLHVASGQSDQRRASLEQAGYSRLLGMPLDKTLLYSALHETGRPATTDGQVVRLIDRYTSPVSRQPLSILLADSDSSDRHRVRNLLKRMGHEVFVADDGIHVLDALDGHRFDLAIVSLDLNRASGLETFKLHRFSHVGNTKVPFIILLERADSELMRRCELTGVDGMLIKPLDRRKLSQTVEAAVRIDRKKASGAPREPAAATSRWSREIHGVLLDTRRLLELDRLGGSSDFLQKLIEGFRLEGRRLLRQMDESARLGDHRHFRDLGQALSDTAGNVGAFELNRAGIAAGRIDPADFPDRATELVTEIRTLYQNTEKALLEFLSENNGSGHRGSLD